MYIKNVKRKQNTDNTSQTNYFVVLDQLPKFSQDAHMLMVKNFEILSYNSNV